MRATHIRRGRGVHCAVFGLSLLAVIVSVPATLAQSIVVVDEGDQWRFFRGVVDPGADWNLPEFDAEEAGWEIGPSGFGYGDGDDATVLEDMANNYFTVYLRREFEIESDVEDLTWFLQVRYDDGFVAYLDGEEVARRNVAGEPPLFNEPASDHEITTGAGGFDEAILLEDLGSVLEEGSHVLAVEVHNATIDSSDLSFSARLEGAEVDVFGLQFDGESFASAEELELFDEGTIELWVRRETEGFFNPWRVSFAVRSADGADALTLETQNGGLRARTFVGEETLVLGAEVANDPLQWHHVALSFSPSGRRLFFDGRLVAADAVSMVLPETAGVRVGSGFVDGGFFAPQPFTGVVESVRVWNVQRPDENIARDLFRRLTGVGDAPGLEAAWPLDEGSGGVAGNIGPSGVPLVLGAVDGPDESDPSWTPIQDFPSFALTAAVPSQSGIAGGVPVRLFGAGFRDEAPPQVLFGDVDVVDVAVLDAWTLVVEAPPAQRFGAVDIVAVDGPRSARLVGGFEYVAPALYHLVEEGEEWDYALGFEPPPSDWREPGFDADAAGWSRGPSGIGYGDDDDATQVFEMQNTVSTLYARRVFHVSGTSRLQILLLRLRYDDGFVAYINGTEIARENVVGQPPAFDELASDQHEILGGPGTFDIEIDLLEEVELFRRGENVLAIEVHNATLDSSDLSLSAELVYFAPGGVFTRGDVDGSGKVTISDVVLVLLHDYGGAVVPCSEAADADDDGSLSTTDAVFLLNYLFHRGAPPPAPFARSGLDLDDDGIACLE